MIAVFILGLCIGSFLNVVIDRLPRGQSIIRGRSFCDHCKKTLLWYDLIPVLSFFLLGRSCRFCHKKISWQYPTVEFITGLLFLITFSIVSQISGPQYFVLFFIYYLIIISSLIVIFFTDLKYRIIPDQILIVQIIGTFCFLLLFRSSELINHFLAGVFFFLIFLALVLITRGKGMGLGDVKFAAVMGFILGAPKIVVAFYLSFLTGAVFSLILIMMGKKSMKSTIPFGPFLAVSTGISLLYGDALWNIFRGFIGL